MKNANIAPNALKKKQLQALEILEKQNGNVMETCKALNIGRSTFYLWRDESQEFASRVESIKEGLLDFAESKLHELIKAGHIAAICFYLKCQGKHRGYVEKMEIFATTRQQTGSFQPGVDDPAEYIEKMMHGQA